MVIKNALKEEILENFYWDGRLNSSSVEVEVMGDGEVILKGFVPTRSHRFIAEDIAHSIEGVNSVRNEIFIALQDVLVFNDNEKDVLKSIDFALTFCPEIPSAGIDLKREGDSIVMEGKVQGYWQKECAIEIARQIAKDNNIVDELEVLSRVNVDCDKNVYDVIKDSFERRGIFDRTDVKFRVEDGEVFLEGESLEGDLLEEIFDSVRFCQGVKNVSREIEVDAESDFNEEGLGSEIDRVKIEMKGRD